MPSVIHTIPLIMPALVHPFPHFLLRVGERLKCDEIEEKGGTAKGRDQNEGGKGGEDGKEGEAGPVAGREGGRGLHLGGKTTWCVKEEGRERENERLREREEVPESRGGKLKGGKEGRRKEGAREEGPH